MKTMRLAAAAALATFVAANGASALSLEFDGWTNGNQSVNVTAPGYNGAAGAFEMKDTSTQNSFVVFCLDIIGKIYSGQTYDYAPTATPFSNSTDLIANGGVNRIQKLFDSGFDTALNSTVESAGFQVALWNAVYDTDWSVSNGDGVFYETAANNGVQAQANAYLANAESYTGPSIWDLTYFEGLNTDPNRVRSQNLVTAELAPVPLPAAGIMLVTALGGLFAARRRKAA